MAPTMRKAHDTLPDVAGDLYGHDHRSDARGHLCAVSIFHAPAKSIRGVDEQRAAIPTPNQHRQIVKPAVVRPNVASADQHEALAHGVELGQKKCDVTCERL